jgi:siroheme synthase-like protein
MLTHPVFLRVEGRRCVIVGGDGGAEAKTLACLEAGGLVTVVAPELTPGLARLAAEGRIEHHRRPYQQGDLAGAALAYAVVADQRLIARLREDAERERVLLNVVDVPDASTFLAPSVLRRGELLIAVGTGGASPGLSARLRRQLEAHVGPEYGPFVALLGSLRHVLAGSASRTAILGELLDSPLLDLVRRGRSDEVDRLLERVAGEGMTLARLGVRLGMPG